MPSWVVVSPVGRSRGRWMRRPARVAPAELRAVHDAMLLAGERREGLIEARADLTCTIEVNSAHIPDRRRSARVRPPGRCGAAPGARHPAARRRRFPRVFAPAAL